MSTDQGAVRRYDATDPEDFRYLVETGLVWQGPQWAQQQAIDMIVAGQLPAPLPDTVPPAVLRYIRSKDPEAL